MKQSARRQVVEVLVDVRIYEECVRGLGIHPFVDQAAFARVARRRELDTHVAPRYARRPQRAEGLIHVDRRYILMRADRHSRVRRLDAEAAIVTQPVAQHERVVTQNVREQVRLVRDRPQLMLARACERWLHRAM